MQVLSVVIVCKNEAGIIGKTLQSLQGLTDDIIVYDNGSTDNTVEIIKRFDVHLYQGSWEGFGKTKNKATTLAKYDWVLSLDADEAIDDELKKTLLTSPFDDNRMVYEIKFKNFLVNKWLRYGEWGGDKHIRVFNRQQVNWNNGAVHEKLLLPEGTKTNLLKGNILHQTATDLGKYRSKLATYAELNAKKYYGQGKKAGVIKKYAAAFFSFVQNYIFRAGFLDGKAGYVCAKMTAYYTFLKYARLKELNQRSGK